MLFDIKTSKQEVTPIFIIELYINIKKYLALQLIPN